MAKVLVVDDHAHVRGAVRRALSRDGHEVWDAADGIEALDLVGVADFDLVITDVCMTGVDGTELLVRLQLRGFTTPVIAMSGGGLAPREELLAEATLCGACATLLKPFTRQQLAQVVAQALRGATQH